VRSASPGTRETDLLQPANIVDEIHGIVLSGGSAFGLTTCDGVVRYLVEKNVGIPVTPTRKLPIVSGAVIFDLGRGKISGNPIEEYGYLACKNAKTGECPRGSIGVGLGALAGCLKGGVGTSSLQLPNGTIVGILVVLNSTGQVFSPFTGELYADYYLPNQQRSPPVPIAKKDDTRESHLKTQPSEPGQATVLAVIATNVKLTKFQLQKVAQMAHDGLSRAVKPAHSIYDGDIIFAVSSNELDIQQAHPQNLLGVLAADACTFAIKDAIVNATSKNDYMSYSEIIKR